MKQPVLCPHCGAESVRLSFSLEKRTAQFQCLDNSEHKFEKSLDEIKQEDGK